MVQTPRQQRPQKALTETTGHWTMVTGPPLDVQQTPRQGLQAREARQARQLRLIPAVLRQGTACPRVEARLASWTQHERCGR